MRLCLCCRRYTGRRERENVSYWKRWEAEALERGVSPELAALGRQVMHEYFHHDKAEHLLGAERDWTVMMDMCLRDPAMAKARFESELGGG